MGKSQFIEDFYVGQKVSDVFLLTQKQLCINKNGGQYLSVKLSDRTGEIDGKKWDTNDSEYENLSEGGFYSVNGLITEFNGVKQLRIDSITRSGQSFDLADFMKKSPRDIEEMKKELGEYIESVKDQNCRKLLDYFFGNPSFYKKFTEAPAAKFLHHAYVYGLLEHTLETCKICIGFADIYDYVNRDVLVMGALLHDIGKIREFETKGSIDLTDEGILLGHLVMGAMMIEEANKKINLSKSFITHAEHLVISHHGQYEWGSPKTPKSLEAMLLHDADDISFRTFRFLEETRDCPDTFTKKISIPFERKLYTKNIQECLYPQEEEKVYDSFEDFLDAFK